MAANKRCTLTIQMFRMLSRIAVRPNGCWEWTGSTDRDGYGQVRWNARLWRVHRLVWTALVGPIPEGLVLDHDGKNGCGNPTCCRPAHMELVTPQVNSARGRPRSQRLTGDEPLIATALTGEM